MKKFLVILLLIVFLNSCDPGWRYYLIKPPLEEVGEAFGPKYLYKDDSLNMVLKAYDFGYETRLRMYIKTTLDSILIYPQFSYIESPHYPDKTQVSNMFDIVCFSNDSLKYVKRYEVSEINQSFGRHLVRLKAWKRDSVVIHDRTEYVTLCGYEFFKPYCLYKGDSLSVFFNFQSYAHFVPRSAFGYHKKEKCDFNFHYDIYGNGNPLIFHFAPGISGKEAEQKK